MSALSRVVLAAALATVAIPALAQDEPSWAVSGGVWATSDYVWRGVSQTQEDPTWQAEVGVEHASGFFAGVFLSGVDFTPPGTDWDDGIDFEANAYLGWSQQISDTLTLGLDYTRIFYPGFNEGFDADFDEYTVALGIGEHYTVAATYSPDTVNLGSSAWYYRVDGEWALGESGFTLAAAAGLYDLGHELGGSYKDYEVSVARSFGNVALKLAYTDTSGYDDAIAESLGERHLADGRAVFTVGYEF